MAAHSKAAIIALAVLAAAFLLHEAPGRGVTAWLRGDIVTELTSKHLNDVREDGQVEAGGTVVNHIAGFIRLFASHAAGKSCQRPVRAFILP